MSQYPYQYPQPQVGFAAPDPYAALLGPVKRAAVLTFIVGGLALLGTLCLGGVGLAATEEMLGPMMQSAQDPNVTPGIIRIVLVIMAVLGLVFSLTLLVLGFFIWRASAAATITAIVLTSLALALTVLNSVVSLPHARGMGGPELVGFGCVTLLFPLLMIGYLLMLIMGFKSIRQYRNAQTSYQAQYWQYQQQQQMYGQGGYANQQPPASSNPNRDPGGASPTDPPAPGAS